MSAPQPKSPPPFVATGPPQETATAPDGSLTYTVVAPGPPGPPRPMAPPPPYRGAPVPTYSRRPAPVLSPQVVDVLVSGLALIAVVLGLTLDGPVGIGWDAFLAWSIFACAAGTCVLAGAATDRRAASWMLQCYGAAALAVFWAIATRPIAVSNVGFLMTFGVALAIVCALRNPSRPPIRAMIRPRGTRRR